MPHGEIKIPGWMHGATGMVPDEVCSIPAECPVSAIPGA